MGLNMWCIFATLLLASVGASRYDQGPQRFYDVSSDTETSEQNDNKEVILYLTPEQVSALEAGGAVVRSTEEPENDEAEPEQPEERPVNEDQEEASEQDENEDAQEEEAQEEEQENPEDIQDQDLDFEEILRILNEEQVEEEEEAAEEQTRNEPQVREENTESPRNFSPRITLRQQQQQQQQQQQEERYLAPAVAKKEQILKSYSFIRYQPNVQIAQQQQEEAAEAEELSEEPQTEAPTNEKKKYKLIPYEVEETEEPAQQNSEAEDDAQRLDDLIAPLLNANRLTAETIGQRKNRLAQNELRLQSILRDLKASPKYNDQKYAIEIERLRANLEKQNDASKAEAITKVAPTLIKQQLNKKGRLNKSKQGKGVARDAEFQQTKPQQLKTQKGSAPRTISVPVLKAEKTEVQRPIPVPVETGKRLSVKNIYVKTRADKPYIISRRVPENKRQSPVEVPAKPERITILRLIGSTD